MVEPGFFVDRGPELRSLEEAWASGRPGLVAVYGRRRVGKTRLIMEWLRGKPHAYYQAGLWPGNLEGLAAAAAEQLGLEPLREAAPRSLRGLFSLLAALLGSRRAAVVLDEFTYWLRVEPGVVSELQYVVDHVLPGTRLLLVVSGSLVGLMQREVLGGGSPLYGRALLRRRLAELPPWCLPWFAPRYGPVELVEAYAFFGGLPFYLRLVDDSSPPLEELLRILGPGGVLEDEPLFLLREEFREPSPYLALLRALSQGATSLGEAAQLAGLPTSHASRYLHTLRDLGLVERERLLFQRRRSRYRVADNLLAAWLAVVEPAASLLRDNPPAGRRLAAGLAARHVARVWERLSCLHAVSQLAPRLGLSPSTYGRLERRGEEIDCAVIDESSETVLLVEAKWSSLTAREAERIANAAARKAQALLPSSMSSYRVIAAVYARSADPPGDALVVTARDMPWGSGCPGPARGASTKPPGGGD